MLSSTSGQKFHNDKKPKKKYQKFKGNQEKEKTVEKAEHSLPNETVQISPGFVDLKDFPELRASIRQNKNKFFETKNNKTQFKSDGPCVSVVTGRNETKQNEAFPPLGNTKMVERKYEIKKETKDTVHRNVLPEAANIGGAEKQSLTSNKEISNMKKTLQPQRNPNKKKRSEPVFINFQDILAANKVRRRRRRTGKIEHQIVRSKFQRQKNTELLSGNYLDSSNPKRNKGKHREIKKKKLSNFKMTIIKERIIKSKIREMAVAANFGSGSVNFHDKIDFKTEIKTYLNELNEKKLKNAETKKAKISENTNNEKQSTEIQETLGMKLLEKKENLENASSVKQEIIPCTTAKRELKFSSKFREYCDNMITPDLNSAVAKLIEELIKLQDRLFLRDPIKAKAKKRHVSGIREVRKYLCLKKVKLIIIAPNLEKLQMEGSVYDSINELKAMCDSQNVPYCFALDRYKLGRCTKKHVPVSAFAVLSYEGLEGLFENVLQELEQAKKKFSEQVKPKELEGEEDINSRVLFTLISAFEELLQVPKEAPSDVN